MSEELGSTLEERGGKYGPYHKQGALAYNLFSQLDRYIKKDTPPFQIDALYMICVKLSRIAMGDASYPDNWLDIAGYSTLVHNELTKEPK